MGSREEKSGDPSFDPLQPFHPGYRSALMKIGLATTGFISSTNDEMAQLAAEAGVHCVQLFFTQTDSAYWKYNGRADVSAITGPEARRMTMRTVIVGSRSRLLVSPAYTVDSGGHYV